MLKKPHLPEPPVDYFGYKSKPVRAPKPSSKEKRNGSLDKKGVGFRLVNNVSGEVEIFNTTSQDTLEDTFQSSRLAAPANEMKIIENLDLPNGHLD